MLGFERSLSIDVEKPLHLAFREHRVVYVVANGFYWLSLVSIPWISLVLLYRRNFPRYLIFRDTLALATALACVLFWVHPQMPPRLFDQEHESLAEAARSLESPWLFGSSLLLSATNPFAAMPSVHVTWAVWSAFAFPSSEGKRSLWLAIVAYPLATAIVVIVTANHLIVDVTAGAALLFTAWALTLIAHRVLKWRSERIALD